MKKLKMITESFYDLEINESKDKKYYLEGTFAVAEKRNENGRIYKRDILKNQIDKYIEEKVKTRQSLGECNHPLDRSEVDITKAAILVEDLQWKDDDTAWGKARVLEGTPYGDIVKGLLKNNCAIAVSSRGLGELDENNFVKDSYMLLAFDLVSSPSAPNAFLNSTLEGKEFTVPSEKHKNHEYSYEDVKKLITNGNKITLNPKEIKELLDEGHTPETIKGYIDSKLDEHYKKVFQVIENLK